MHTPMRGYLVDSKSVGTNPALVRAHEVVTFVALNHQRLPLVCLHAHDIVGVSTALGTLPILMPCPWEHRVLDHNHRLWRLGWLARCYIEWTAPSDREKHEPDLIAESLPAIPGKLPVVGYDENRHRKAPFRKWPSPERTRASQEYTSIRKNL